MAIDEEVHIDVGRRVVVVSNLLLSAPATAGSSWASNGIAEVLRTWQGDGLMVIAGNFIQDDSVTAALDAHGELTAAIREFMSQEGRRIILVPGSNDRQVAERGPRQTELRDLGIEVMPSVHLHLSTAAGIRRVLIDSGAAAPSAQVPLEVQTNLLKDPGVEWQAGMDRLADPADLQRFVTSRVLYRRFTRFSWYLLLPFVVVLLLSLPIMANWLAHLFRNVPIIDSTTFDAAIDRAKLTTLGDRLLAATLLCAAALVVVATVLGVVSRKAWSALGGGVLSHDPIAGATANDAPREMARQLQLEGYSGLVSGATLQAELTDLGAGFFACAGISGEIVEEHPGRFGLPPVFLHHRHLAWIELETGAELHARLLMLRAEMKPATRFERIIARYQPERDPNPVVVAAHPAGTSWPAAPDLAMQRRQARRNRRIAAAAIAITGIVNLVSAITPPLRGRLHLVLEVLPLGVSQAAGALVALAGIGLLALARGVRRGQRQAWQVASVITALTFVAHLVRDAGFEVSTLSGLVLIFLLVHRAEFTAETDHTSTRRAAIALGAGIVGIPLVSILVVQTTVILHRNHMRRSHLSWSRTTQAVLGRMIGIQTVKLPDRVNDFLAPALLTIGVTLVIVAVLLLTRPVVDRRRTSGRGAAEGHARDIVMRHGKGTLDYFALRSDKRWFFHRDSLVAYAIYGGVCLVSPDPIGPPTERSQIWSSFRRYADSKGWAVAIMGSAEEWLPLYRSTGMHDIYLGDEAVVDIPKFSLAGGNMKGLRQAYNRIAKYGYTATFHDPSRLDPVTAQRLTGLMSQSRRGEFERGFSMMLGRIFDRHDTGLLLCVVTAPDGNPAAMCQFVPAPGIGGYSLDLMRRDRSEHPNGLIDFALVATIEHLRALGAKGLSLNFAAMRSILDGERGDGITQRAERWALKRMSSFMQIETLWKFNAKFMPTWLPRYVVYDAAEHLVPVTLAILRAESVWEVPIIGRVIAGERKARDEFDCDASSLLPTSDDLSGTTGR